MNRFVLMLLFFLTVGLVSGAEKIDRRALVQRHRLSGSQLDLLIPVGNGELCFNIDGTGMQTFTGNTLSHWGWHSTPLPAKYKPSDVPATGTFQKGRNKGLDVFPKDKEDLRQWMRNNPHRANIARIRLMHSDSKPIEQKEITDLQRDMNLWTGVHTANYKLNGVPVRVETCIADREVVAIHVVSPSAASGKFEIVLDFSLPFGEVNRWIPGKAWSHDGWNFGGWMGKFDVPNQHVTKIAEQTDNRVLLDRTADDWHYQTGIFCDGATIRSGSTPHQFRLIPNRADFTVAFRFAPKFQGEAATSFGSVKKESEQRWENFWLTGGAIDLSGSSDPRWKELERRIVLSQFEMRTNSAGSWPCSECGLLGTDCWVGRFHMEMVWWHLAHYYLWGREALADDAVSCYAKFKGNAKELAAQLGYKGYQWQKETAPEVRTAPWVGSNVLLWKEPHPFFFAELEYRVRPTRATLEKWADILEGTAEYMADYPVRDDKGVYHLDPVMPPCERGVTKDTVFDLAYWRYGLRQANIWRERLGKEKNPNWEKIANNLAPLPVNQEGVYVHSAEWFDSYTDRNWEHPDLIGVYGMLPPLKGVDPETARKTVKKVMSTWQWNRCWGWDFPWMAMAAARTGQPEIAVDILLNDSPRNRYDERGVNTGGPCPYLPGNGGLLYAVALMAAGWDGAPNQNAPGFPQSGWKVRWEGLKTAP